MYICIRNKKQNNLKRGGNPKQRLKIMTRQLLEKVAKAKGIDLSMYDHVTAIINEAYTFVIIRFWTLEVVGGNRHELFNDRVKLSISAILKREEEWPEDYETSPYGEWIYNIK